MAGAIVRATGLAPHRPPSPSEATLVSRTRTAPQSQDAALETWAAAIAPPSLRPRRLVTPRRRPRPRRGRPPRPLRRLAPRPRVAAAQRTFLGHARTQLQRPQERPSLSSCARVESRGRGATVASSTVAPSFATRGPDSWSIVTPWCPSVADARSESSCSVLRSPWAQRFPAVMLAVHSPTVPPLPAWAGVTAPLKRTACCAHCGHLGVLAPGSAQAASSSEPGDFEFARISRGARLACRSLLL